MRCYQDLLGNTLGTNKKPPLPLSNPKKKNIFHKDREISILTIKKKTARLTLPQEAT